MTANGSQRQRRMAAPPTATFERGGVAVGPAHVEDREAVERVIRHHRRRLGLQEGKIHRLDPDFGSTLPVSNRDSQSNCGVNLKMVGQPCEFQV